MNEVNHIILRYIKQNMKKVAITIIIFLMGSILSLIPAKITQLIIDSGFMNKDLNLIILLAFGLLIVYIGKVVSEFITNKIFINLSSGLMKCLKDEIYNRILTLDMSFFSNNEVGYINSRISEISQIDILFSAQTLGLISSAVQFVFSIAILLSINWKFLSIMMIPIPIFIVIMRKTTKIIRNQIKESFDNSAKYAGKINESISGIENIKAQSLEKKEKEKISSYNEKMINTAKKQSNTFNGFNGSINFLSFFLNVLTYIIGGIFFVQNELTLGGFMAVSSYIGKVYTPVFTYSSMTMVLQPAFIALKRVSNFFFKESNDSKDIGSINIVDVENITFDKVYFGHIENKDIIRDFSMSICRGEKVFLKGKNGCGKSTLFRLLLRLYPVKSGKIYLNGCAINDITRDSILKNIKYVAQKSFLFNDSIQNNILYGLEDYDKQKYDELIEAFSLKQLIDRIDKESNGLIGENGCNLSGGEIQKLVLCRTFIQNPKCIILDEATSNLDSKSRKIVKEYIQNSYATILIVDHTEEFRDVCDYEITI